MVAVVNRRFAERFFPDGRVVGRRIRLVEPTAATNPWRVIVGVVPDTFLGGTDVNRGWGVYAPLEQHPTRAMNLVVRAKGAPGALAPWMRRAVAEVDAGLPVGGVATMQEVIALATWPTRLFGSLFASFGVASLFLSVVGLYGVVSFSTGQRRHEIGIRVALGATPAGIVALVLRQGVWQLLTGATLGLAGGFMMSSVFAQIEPGMRVVDPLPHALVIGALTSATLVAYLVPARRATRGEPAMTLRN